jgi:hypothetical protein
MASTELNLHKAMAVVQGLGVSQADKCRCREQSSSGSMLQGRSTIRLQYPSLGLKREYVNHMADYAFRAAI